MRHIITSTILPILALFHSPSFAEETTAADPYTALAEALSSDEVWQLRFDKDMELSFFPVLEQDPDTRQIDQDCPGYIAGMAKVMTPPMLEGHAKDQIWYRTQLEELFRSKLSSADAKGAADFYGSDAGQDLLSMALNNASATNTVQELIESPDFDPSISAEAYRADVEAMKQNLQRNLDPKEMHSIGLRLAISTWFPAFRKLAPNIEAINVEMINNDYSPEINARLDGVIEEFVNAHLDACDAYQE